jgi:hypothetical protein
VKVAAGKHHRARSIYHQPVVGWNRRTDKSIAFSYIRLSVKGISELAGIARAGHRQCLCRNSMPFSIFDLIVMLCPVVPVVNKSRTMMYVAPKKDGVPSGVENK